MSMKITSSMALALALVLGAFVPMYAQATQIGLDANSSVGVNDIVDIDADTSAEVDVGVQTETTGATMEAGTATTETETSTEVSDRASEETASGVIVVTRASAEQEEGPVSVTSASSVQTNADLSAYASTLVRSDENVERIELAGDTVMITYQQRAEFLGVVPTLITTRATVASDGEISLQYPWYSFLYSTDDSASLETEVSTTVAATLSGGSTMDASGEFTARTQAALLQSVYTVMKNNLEASLAADASANAAVETQ